jgi:hypothetical protein
MTAWKNEYIARCQVPEPGTLLLDHLTYFVPDHAAADAALKRMGFTTTPLSSHIRRGEDGVQPVGGGNHCVMLRRGYLAFLTPSGDTKLAASLRESMQRYVGPHSTLLGTADPQTDHARLTAAGFKPHAVAAMERPVTTPDGEMPARMARVSVESAHGGLQFVQQKTPELLWQQRWLDHPNRAFGLAAALYCVDDPGEAAAHYAQLTGIAVTPGTPPRIVTARGDLVFLSRDTLRKTFDIEAPVTPWIAGAVLECSDTLIPRSRLEMNDFTTHDLTNGRFSVMTPPEIGGLLVFGPIGRAIPDFIV